MQKRTMSYIGEVAVFSSALIPGALRPGLGQSSRVNVHLLSAAHFAHTLGRKPEPTYLFFAKRKG